MMARRFLQRTVTLTLLAAAVLVPATHPRKAAAATSCSEFTALRVSRFRSGAERAIQACVKRSAHTGATCPDARLTKRLGALHASAVRAIERRCPGSGGENQIAAEEASVLCELLAMCPDPTHYGSVNLRVLASSGAGFARDPSSRALRFDAGWTGLSHKLSVLEGADVTAELDNCDGQTDTVCDLHGTTTGVSFGAPSPISAGGVMTCMTAEFGSDLTGTLDTATGELTESAELHVVYYKGLSIYAPCPTCAVGDGDPQLGEAGTCQAGPNFGQPCTVGGLADQGYGADRATSGDCPPDPARLIGDFHSAVTATTGQVSFGITNDSPPCSGKFGEKCLCDTCNTAQPIACGSDADCPESGGAPGICGGRRCITGPMNGMPCTSGADCGSGSICSRAGEPTKPDACLYLEDESPTGCQPVAADYGECVSGPVDQFCENQRRRGCTRDEDCQPPSGVIPGDRCVAANRGCLLDPIVTVGTPDPPVDSVAHPVVVGAFCMGPSGRAIQNNVTGLPGPVRFIWPSELTLGE